MSAAHTPGPLTTRVSKEGDVAVMQGHNVVAECFASIRHAYEDARPEALANAKLYSAAPDLLAFAQGVVELDSLISREDLVAGLAILLEHARAAIAKATGDAS